LKVRCEFASDADGPCKRCAKAGRNCIVTQPTRKRQKKTDSRVAELEKKIDALTASLQATRSPGGPGGPGGFGGGGAPIATASSVGQPPVLPHPSLSAPPVPISPMTRDENHRSASGFLGVGPGRDHGYGQPSRDWARQTREQQPLRPASQAPSSTHSNAYSTRLGVAGQKRKFADGRENVGEDVRGSSSSGTSQPQPPRAVDPEPERSDIVGRFLTTTQASDLFARYTSQMAPHLPGVVFPSTMTAAELRRTKPILFLSVMSAASSEMPSIQKNLTKELMQVFAEKVIVTGEKSLELIQALQVAVIWYWPPEHFEELKFYQLLHIAAVMAIDLGLGRKKQVKGGFRKHIPYSWRDDPWKKNAPPDPTTIEARRAWLTCYFLAMNTSMALHRPNLIRWTPFMAECVDILESSPDAAPTDRYFCHLVWTHKLAEEVGIQFSMDDPTSTPSISDARTQYALRGFERELEKYNSSLPPDMLQPSLKLSFHVLSLYMHEIATQNEFTEEPISQSASENFRETLASDAPLTPAHISALSACLTAIDGIFNVFLSLEVSSIRCLPVFNFVRVAYAVVVLIKMYFAASSPRSELGKVINKDNMKVEQHINNLLEKFHATAADDRSRPAAKFLVVLVMLRSWFQKQNQNGSGNRGGNSGNATPGLPAMGPLYPSGAAATTLPAAEAAASAAERSASSSSSPYLPRRESGDNNNNRGSGTVMNTGGGAGSLRPTDYPNTTAAAANTSNTPLQLLSEIATNKSATHNISTSTPEPPRPNNSDLLSAAAAAQQQQGGPPANAIPPWLHRPSQQPFMYDANSGNTTTGRTTSAAATDMTPTAAVTDGTLGGLDGSGLPVMPWLNHHSFVNDFDYANMSDGLAQAMDLTLGGLGLSDETFGGMMGMGGMGGMGMGMAPMAQDPTASWYTGGAGSGNGGGGAGGGGGPGGGGPMGGYGF